MQKDFFQYKIKIRNKQYTTADGLSYENTACISFYDEFNREIDYVERAYIDTESIYNLIDNNKSLNLNECYIENFSLAVYRKSRILSKEEYVSINDFTAIDAIFDSKIQSDFSYAKFNGQFVIFKNTSFINGAVSFNSSHFGDVDADFSYCHFKNGNVDFSNSVFGEGKIEFKNSVFGSGHKNFQYADFGIGTNSFMNTDFGDGDVSFINVNFGDGKTTFKVARFGIGKIDFHFSHFGSDDISFERTEFGHGKTDFRKVDFGTGKVNFNRSVFGNCEVNFEGSTLKNGRMTFLKTTFGTGIKNFELCEFDDSDLIFTNTNLGYGNVSFSQSRFHKLLLTSCHLNNYFDLRVSSCKYLDLSDTVVRDIIDFTPYSHPVDIHILNFEGMRILGQIHIDWKLNKVKDLILKQDKTDYQVKAEQFRILKENYSKVGNYSYEDQAYIQFKRNELKAGLYGSIKENPKNALWQYPLYLFKLIIFDKMGLYATSPARVLTSLVVIYLFFTTLHVLFPFIFNTSINCIDYSQGFFKIIPDTLYYSLITFTTVGYGDCSPVGILRLIAMLEGFIGPFMMSYFTVAFARKILR
ncbi:MAG: hypothetical protein Kow0068_10780 [Marinilabiliales bacterium]